MPNTIPSSLQGWHALIIDDEPDNVMVVQLVLEIHGLNVTTATGGQEALDWLAQNPAPDFVLCDLSMPGVDGWKVIQTVRTTPKMVNLCVFALTAHAMARDIERCLSAGFDAHFAKPIDPMKFVDQLARAILNVPHLAPRLAGAVS